MNRKQADAAFHSLRRHASAIAPPTGAPEAARLLERAVLTPLQRDAIVHYVAVGPDNLALAYSMLKAGATAFAAASFLAGPADVAEEAFAVRLIALSAALDGRPAADRATCLVEAFAGHVAAAQELLCTPGDAAGGAGNDLLEAAGIAYTLAQMLESPPGPREAVAAGVDVGFAGRPGRPAPDDE